MNKAVPWNINGVGFDAREAARDAARRQGKSLGEWLHGVIADHAAEMGVAETDVAGQDRIDAVTTRLERMSARSSDFDRRDRHERPSDRHQVREPAAHAEPTRNRLRAIDETQDARPTRRSSPRDLEDGYESRRPIRSPSSDEMDFLLEDAIDAMDRRAARAERRTDSALASFADMLEANEVKRARERDAVSDLSKKLSAIESKLTDRARDDQSPIKGALARLEARLDMIGRRGAAETGARRSADAFVPPMPRDDSEPIRRLEDKLNSILEAVGTRSRVAAPPQASPVAMAAVRAPLAQPHRRLGDAIAEIAKRQRSLDEASTDYAPAPRERAAAPASSAGMAPNAHQAFAAMQAEMAALATKIEDMRRDVHRREDPPSRDFEHLRADIATMSRSLGDLAPRGTVTALEDSIRGLTKRLEGTHIGKGGRFDTAFAEDSTQAIDGLQTELRAIAIKVDGLASAGADLSNLSGIQDQMHEIRDMIAAAAMRPQSIDVRAALRPQDGAGLEKIERRLEALTAKIDDAAREAGRAAELARRQSAGPDVSSLESLVRDLGLKIEAVQSPGAGDRALDALHDQIALLSERFSRSEHGIASIGTLERSMQDLFAHLEDTRASVETTASRAAREALRIAIDEGRSVETEGTARHIATLRAMQDDADVRTQSTLNAVHETLEKVVDRLSTMEGDIADVRLRRPEADQSVPSVPALSAPAPQSEPIAAPPRRQAASTSRPTISMSLGATQPMLDPVPGPKSTTRPSAEKSDDPGSDSKRTDFIAAARRAAKTAQTDPSVVAMKAAGSGSPARAGLLAQSRDYVSAHKKPMLLSFAALFVILGTMAIMQRMMIAPDEMTAERRAPAPIAKSYASANDRNDLTPSALPKMVPQRTQPGLAAPKVASAEPAPAIELPKLPALNAPLQAPPQQTAALAPTVSSSAAPFSAAIPGSDPIQTGSIPTLPAFAARGATANLAPIGRAGMPNALRTLADAGDGPAEYEIGARYAEGKSVPRDFKLAAMWYGKAAEQGIAPAQYRLASLYEKGIGVAQDKAKAKSLYTKAADAGNPRAMHNLAVLLADGDGHPDYEGAATWFRKAAQYGVHDSEYNLAILLARGLGVQQSLVQSYQWFAVAAEQNDTDAAKKRDEVGLKLSANDLAVAKALAASFRPRTAATAATEVEAPPGGWDGASTSSHLNSAGAKLSSL